MPRPETVSFFPQVIRTIVQGPEAQFRSRLVHINVLPRMRGSWLDSGTADHQKYKPNPPAFFKPSMQSLASNYLNGTTASSPESFPNPELWQAILRQRLNLIEQNALDSPK